MGASGLPITCGREGESLGRATAHDRGGTDQASKGISAAPAVAARALAEDSPDTGKPHWTMEILSHARRRGGRVAARGAFAGAIRSTGFGRDAQTVKDRARKR
jgi:hypothetical protein